ncbi:hypothetical protein CAEBREN_09356 [Caenorhabditis brenneri]|uniref:Uncharacterized protein n=1 Tax=Caenorhabditis brenneri TaxID=135651 RepID=G0PBJ9_CAEBE|nr:hypothetical protein CAEBREN_09356 [Caenorhabditis brenneri]
MYLSFLLPSSSFLFILLALVQPSEEVECFTGNSKQVQVAEDFDFCSVSLIRKTSELHYKGHNGETQFFEGDHYNIYLKNCFTDAIFGGTEDIVCYCQLPLCNHEKSSQEFLEMLFRFHDDSNDFIDFNGSLELFLELYAKESNEKKDDSNSSDI